MAIHLIMFFDTQVLDKPFKISFPDGSIKFVHIVGFVHLTPEILLKDIFMFEILITIYYQLANY